jgi:hypothetical protein
LWVNKAERWRVQSNGLITTAAAGNAEGEQGDNRSRQSQTDGRINHDGHSAQGLNKAEHREA